MEKFHVYKSSRALDDVKIVDNIIIDNDFYDSLSDEDRESKAKNVNLDIYDEHFLQHVGEEFCIRQKCDNSCRFFSKCFNTFEMIDVSGASNIRRSLISRDGYSLASIDYSGIELRVAANIANEPVWIEAFLNKRDIHEETAKLIFKEGVDKYKRKLAKCVTGDTSIDFSNIYGELYSKNIGSLFHEIDLAPDSFYELKDPLYVLNEFGDSKPVRDLYYGGEQDTIRLELDNGIFIEGTGNHKVRVIDEGGNYVWKTLLSIDQNVDLVVVVE